MQNLESLRRSVATREAADAGRFIVERIDFECEGTSIVEEHPDRVSALSRFRVLTGEEMTDAAAIPLVAEGGCYRPTFKVKLESTGQYRLLYGLAEKDATPQQAQVLD